MSSTSPGALKATLLVAALPLLAGSFETASKPDPIRQVRTGASRGCTVSTTAGDRSFGRAAHEHAYFDDDLTRGSQARGGRVAPTLAASLAGVLTGARPGLEPPTSRLFTPGRLAAAASTAESHRRPSGRAPPLS